MSLSRREPSYSSSPSKSSLRRSDHPDNRSLLPSPQFKEPHLEQVTPQQDEPSYEKADTGELFTQPQPHSGFQPFFALVEDTVTHEHFHPTVHYIFADDDSDIITEAACQSLEQEGGSQAIVSSGESRYLPRPAAGVKEHYVVLDLGPSPTPRSNVGGEACGAFQIKHAQSMSSEWQVLRTKITNAPTIGDSEGDEGFMLRIEGRGNTPPDALNREDDKGSMEEMIEKFQKRLDDVRQVMQASQMRIEDEE